MKNFKELKQEDQKPKEGTMNFKEVQENYSPVFEAHEVVGLTPEQVKEAEEIYYELEEYLKDHGLEDLDEGVLGKIIGGVTGFLAGPAVGKTIAKALGIKKGVLYDMFTSRLVNSALGSALGKKLKV